MLGKKSKDPETDASRGRPLPSAGSAPGSVVSKEMVVRGDCVVEGHILIEGRIVGDVRATVVELGSTGSVKGDLTSGGQPSEHAFVIAGEVDGTVRARRVEVRSGGSVLGGIEADEAYVQGRVDGGILARKRLVLEKTAVVVGDVRARRLALAEGGQVNGTIVMGERAGRPTPKAESRSKPEANSEPDATAAVAAEEPVRT